MAGPFATFIKKLNDKYLFERKKIPPVKGLAEQFPCQLCAAAGSLLVKSTFSRVNESSAIFNKLDGHPIVSPSFCQCPSCKGSGLDGDAFLESLDSERGEQVFKDALKQLDQCA